MSGISSSTGLISGLPIEDIINQLMTIEGRPKVMVESRNKELKAQQDALKDINSKLLTLKLTSAKLTLPTGFRQTKATTSNEAVVGVTSGAGAIKGNYAFTVSRLVQSQQTLSRGFADSEATPLSATGGTLTFERGEARLDSETMLSNLNGGAGVSRGMIRITDRSGASTVVDLRSVATIDDVIQKINSSTGVSVHAEADGDGLKISDLSGQTASNLIVADVGTSGTATSLGIAGNAAATTITGTKLNTVGLATQLAVLNDGTGIANKNGVPDFKVTVGGTDYNVNLDGAGTIGDVITRIETATSGAVTGSFTADGLGIKLTGPAGFSVASINSSGAAESLGIAGTGGGGSIDGSRLMAGMNSKLLRNLKGGAGVGLGTISIQNAAGATTNVDLSGAVSVSEVLSKINNAGAGVTASLNSAGNGLLITDNAAGAGSLVIGDVSGTAAVDLGLAGTHTGKKANGGNLQFRYVTEGTRLENLGVVKGKFNLTDSSGKTAAVDLSAASVQTIGDVISIINSRGLAINARINDNGDGILLEDTGPGVVKMAAVDAGATTAKSLNLAGEAANAGDDLNGSFERTIAVTATDTLKTVAQKITDANIGISASIISDGSSATPYRLSLGSKTEGSLGGFTFDDGGLGLDPTNLAKPQDAVVFYGSTDPAQALVITSKTNQLKSLIPGATIDLKSTSDQPVQVSIAKDTEAMATVMQEFVDAFNEVTKVISEVDAYDAETQERGILLGDSTVSTVRSQMFAKIINRNTDLSGQYRSLTQVGIKVGKEEQIEFDKEKFLAALEADPDAVEQLFKFKETEEDAEGKEQITAMGIGVAIDEMLKKLTDPEGAVQGRIDTIGAQMRQNDQRIEDLDDRLEIKRGILERQFAAMESALAEMQRQSSSLGVLGQMAASAGG